MHLLCLIYGTCKESFVIFPELAIINSLTQYQYLPHCAFATTELSFIRRKAVAKIHNKKLFECSISLQNGSSCFYAFKATCCVGCAL